MELIIALVLFVALVGAWFILPSGEGTPSHATSEAPKTTVSAKQSA